MPVEVVIHVALVLGVFGVFGVLGASVLARRKEKLYRVSFGPNGNDGLAEPEMMVEVCARVH